MEQPFNKINKVEGSLSLPGDKSISHRSVIFSSLAEGAVLCYSLNVTASNQTCPEGLLYTIVTIALVIDEVVQKAIFLFVKA